MIGGEAKSNDHYGKPPRTSGRYVFGALGKAAVLEVNASMGLIAAAPDRGGSSWRTCTFRCNGDERRLSDEKPTAALKRHRILPGVKCLVSGKREAGCQAEAGAASAMSASAITRWDGETSYVSDPPPVLSNLLGLFHPLQGLVDPQSKAEMRLSSQCDYIRAELAFEWNFIRWYRYDWDGGKPCSVSGKPSFELRETDGGCAGTIWISGCKLGCEIL